MNKIKKIPPRITNALGIPAAASTKDMHAKIRLLAGAKIIRINLHHAQGYLVFFEAYDLSGELVFAGSFDYNFIITGIWGVKKMRGLLSENELIDNMLRNSLAEDDEEFKDIVGDGNVYVDDRGKQIRLNDLQIQIHTLIETRFPKAKAYLKYWLAQ